jgi:hypothetical protein
VSAPHQNLVMCPGCERPNPPNRRTCWGCGTALPLGTAPPIFAPPPSGPPSGSAAGRPAVARSPAPSVPPGSGAWPSLPPPTGSSATPAAPRVAPVNSTGSPWGPNAPPLPAADRPFEYNPEPARLGRGRKVGIAVGAVVVVIVVVVIAAIALHASSSPTAAAVVFGQPMSEAAALGPAESTQATRTGGPWTTFGLEGWGISTSVSGGAGAIASCTTLWQNSTPLTIEATPAGASAGELAFWVLLATNAAGDVLLTSVSEANGTVLASNAAEYGGTCFDGSSTDPAIPSGLVPSTTVAATADDSGGSTFLAKNPGASQLFTVLENLWVILYTSCSLVDASGTGSLFLAEYNATTGVAIGSPTTTDGANCATSA